MKPARIFFTALLLVVLILPAAAARAQTDTPPPPTPTASLTSTFVPIFEVPTNLPPLTGNDCANGLPTGYGTLTPVADWDLNCGHCNYQATATALVAPTGTQTSTVAYTPFFPTGTVAPSATNTTTPGPTSTATLTGSNPNLGYRATIGTLTIQAPWPTSVTDYTGNNWIAPDYPGSEFWIVGVVLTTVDNGGSGTRYVVPGDPSDNSISAGTGVSAAKQMYMPVYSTMPALFKSQYSQAQWEAAVSALQAFALSAYTIKYDYTYEHYPLGGSSNWTGVNYRAQRVGGLGRNDTLIDGYIYWIKALVPTATPTPSPGASYCKTITGYGAGTPVPTIEPFDPFDFIPIPIIGDQACYTLIPALAVDVPDFLEEWISDIDFGGVSVCVRLIEFGIIDMMGVGISIDAIAIALAGIAIFRWLMRTAT